MNKASIAKDFPEVRRAYPSAILSTTYNYLRIPVVELPVQFSPATTSLLIHLRPESDYAEPEWYVNRSLRVYGQRSHHLDENLTPMHMLSNGWVKLCIKQVWGARYTLVDAVLLALKFLKNLRE